MLVHDVLDGGSLSAVVVSLRWRVCNIGFIITRAAAAVALLYADADARLLSEKQRYQLGGSGFKL
jgi:hypothetical protein